MRQIRPVVPILARLTVYLYMTYLYRVIIIINSYARIYIELQFPKTGCVANSVGQLFGEFSARPSEYLFVIFVESFPLPTRICICVLRETSLMEEKNKERSMRLK